MNNQLATHFRTYFQMDAADASALAGAFGLMNLFARPVFALITPRVCFSNRPGYFAAWSPWRQSVKNHSINPKP